MWREREREPRRNVERDKDPKGDAEREREPRGDVEGEKICREREGTEWAMLPFICLVLSLPFSVDGFVCFWNSFAFYEFFHRNFLKFVL